jgi:hypothetical protein
LVEGDRVVAKTKDSHAKEGAVTKVHQSAPKVDVNFGDGKEETIAIEKLSKAKNPPIGKLRVNGLYVDVRTHVQFCYTGEGALVKTKEQPTLKALQDVEAIKPKAKAAEKELEKKSRKAEALRKDLNLIAAAHEKAAKKPRRKRKSSEPVPAQTEKKSPRYISAKCSDAELYGLFNIRATGEVYTKANAVFLNEKAASVEAERLARTNLEKLIVERNEFERRAHAAPLDENGRGEENHRCWERVGELEKQIDAIAPDLEEYTLEAATPISTVTKSGRRYKEPNKEASRADMREMEERFNTEILPKLRAEEAARDANATLTITLTKAQMREVVAVLDESTSLGMRTRVGLTINRNKLVFDSAEDYQRIGKVLIEGLDKRERALDILPTTDHLLLQWRDKSPEGIAAKKKLAIANGAIKACRGAYFQISFGDAEYELPEDVSDKMTAEEGLEASDNHPRTLEGWRRVYEDARDEAKYAELDARLKRLETPKIDAAKPTVTPEFVLTHQARAGFTFCTEPYLDSLGPFRDGVISILACLARQERIRLSERTLSGLERARAQGHVGGRPRIDCDRGKLLKLRAAGKSLGEIARELGISKTTVHRIVKGSCWRHR